MYACEPGKEKKTTKIERNQHNTHSVAIIVMYMRNYTKSGQHMWLGHIQLHYFTQENIIFNEENSKSTTTTRCMGEYGHACKTICV